MNAFKKLLPLAFLAFGSILVIAEETADASGSGAGEGLDNLETAVEGATVIEDGTAEPSATEAPEIGSDAAEEAEAPKAGGENLEETTEGYLIKDAALNDIFQFLAKSADRQYFHNLQINGPDFMVTGHLDDGNPLNQMEELAFMYGLSLHTKGNTVYALTQSQLSQLPSAEWHYQLKYLRPTDIEQIKALIRPMLSPGTGIVNFEPKTNTIVIVDSATRIEAARKLLHGVDKAKGQIIVETKILRINSSAAEKIGVNWTNAFGDSGVPLQLSGNLGNLFGIPTNFVEGSLSTSSPGEFTSDSGSIILTPIQISGVLKALNEGGISNQISNPTLITEDNEQATISIIDRIPIITSTTTPGGAGGQPTVSEEVRYKIDSSDQSITEDPDNHREIGISIAVTPTLLPDGTIRMKMRPRSAQITGEVIGVGVGGQEGNRYPEVTESMIETLARIPDGYSLVVGGFYGEVQNSNKNKVPLLGDIPILNFFFKSKEATKEQTSLVFIVTPTSYDPTNGAASNRASRKLEASSELPADHHSINPYNPGPAHEPNLRRTLRGMRPSEAPYYPRTTDLHATPEREKIEKPERTKPRFSRMKRR
jgi:type II secretory pathway component GspD/PulD (secretin)